MKRDQLANLKDSVCTQNNTTIKSKAKKQWYALSKENRNPMNTQFDYINGRQVLKDKSQVPNQVNTKTELM